MLKKYIFILLAGISLSNASETTNDNPNAQPLQNNPTFLERAQLFCNNNGELFQTKNLAIGSCVMGTIGIIVSAITRKISYLFLMTGIGIGSYTFLQSNDQCKKYLPSVDQITDSFKALANINWQGKVDKIKESFK